MSHDPHPFTGDCICCGMTRNEMADFALIECQHARAAGLPAGNPSRIPRGWLPLTDQQALQRGLMIEGLWSVARKAEASRRQLREWEARQHGCTTVVSCDPRDFGIPKLELTEAERPE